MHLLPPPHPLSLALGLGLVLLRKGSLETGGGAFSSSSLTRAAPHSGEYEEEDGGFFLFVA